MAEIPLTGKRGVGRTTKLSADRYEAFFQVGWTVKRFPSGYEQVIRTGKGGWKIPLARLIMGQIVDRPLLSSEHVHHKNHDTLDNRDENLLLLTKGEHIAEHNRENRSYERAEQAATQKARANPKAGAYHNGYNRWTAYFKGKYLGMFKTQEEAIACYRKAVSEGVHAARVIIRDPNDENRGVFLRSSGRWEARFKSISLGTCDTKEEAIMRHRKAVAEGIDAARRLERTPDDPNRGLFQTPSGRFRACYNKKYLGLYDTREEARAVYLAARAAHEALR